MPEPKKPQDHKKKAAKRLQDEATDNPMDTLLGRVITVEGRLGSVNVTVLEDPMEWDAEADEILAGWSKAGGIIVGEMIPFLRCIISVEDSRAIDAIRPSRKTAGDLVAILTGDEDESPGEELGESAAS